MKKGIVFIILAVAIFTGYLLVNYHNKGKSLQNEVKATMATTEPVLQTESLQPEKTENPETAEQTMHPEQNLEPGQELSTEIKIIKLEKEVLKILGIRKKRMEKELKIYANGCGLANASEAVYAGETVINHINNTVSVAFYIETPETDIYNFYAVYNKAEDTFSFEAW